MPCQGNISVPAPRTTTTDLPVADGHNAVATGGFFHEAATDLLIKTVQPGDFLHGYTAIHHIYPSGELLCGSGLYW